MKFKVVLSDSDGYEKEQIYDLSNISDIYKQTVFDVESVTPIVDAEFEKDLNLVIDEIIEDMQSYTGKLSSDDELHRRLVSAILTLVFSHRAINKNLLEPMLKEVISDAASILNIEPMEHEIDNAVSYVKDVTLKINN